ncbi:IQ calmodulin-binding motif protein [Paecilomyces variotii No. 5]|uniref:IQ calmodulin-binding motif protein n=1 Tax=Byssochlamys spectabilis (strain No. 5 / NBRC 109023) TaxID=1356009 RepID=V5FZV4_BYSSN|nr:IQ calmodulin-binding motif protein [Paecilomyces variotii No. 5]
MESANEEARPQRRSPASSLSVSESEALVWNSASNGTVLESPGESHSGNEQNHASAKQRPISGIVPPYWRHYRDVSRNSMASFDGAAAITLEDHTEDPGAETSRGLWAKSVTIDDYVVVQGKTGVGAYVGGPMVLRLRYSEFDDLRQKLLQAFPNSKHALPPLPPKSVLFKFRPSFLEKRRESIIICLQMPYPDQQDQQDTGVAVLNVMAGLGVSPQTVADEHTTNDVRSSPSRNEAENIQTDKPERPGMTDAEREKAARIIQRNYRGYKTRRELKGFGLDASTRWLEAVKEAQWRQSTRPQLPHAEEQKASSPGEKTPAVQAHETWKRVGSIARRAGGDDNIRDEVAACEASEDGQHGESQSQGRQSSTAVSGIDSEKTAKMMDLQYFLEMVDTKHRHGSNLRTYHNYWKNSPSKQNFFYWLDYGDGKTVDLPRCPRDRLEREQVRYLSREERMNYLVQVDESGRFRWAKNGERVSTDSNRFKDSINGVVPVEDHAPRFRGNSAEGNVIVDTSSSSSNSDEESDSSSEEVNHYLNHDLNEAKGVKKLAYVSPAVIFNHLMKKSLKKKDKWIFVADTSFRLYVGIKESGAFQHSSFLRGARISSAGVIKIKDGQLRSLSPLSGHYRPPAVNFRRFVHALEDQGVDMSRVSISKSYAVLVGIEGYAKVKKGKKKFHEKMDTLKAKHNQHKESDSSHADKLFKTESQTGDHDPQQNDKDLPIRPKGRGVPGTAPEEGVPPPEGTR